MRSACFAIAAAFAASMVASAVMAQAPKTSRAAPPHATRIILLGTTGGPIVTKFHSEPASLLVVDGTTYLIDAGAGVERQLAWAGYKPSQVQNIFITHHHVDHNAGLPSLISLMWFGRSWYGETAPPTQIYGPPATEFLVKTALQYLSVSERIFTAGVPNLAPAAPMFQAHDIGKDGQVFKDDKVQVMAAENTHFYFKSGTPETGQDRSYSYRFNTPAGSVVFTGDTGFTPAVVALAQGADVLVSEINIQTPEGSAPRAANGPKDEAAAHRQEAENFHMVHEHITPEEVAKIASSAHVKTVILTHLVPTRDDQTDATKFTARVKANFPGQVIAGRDLFEYDLP